MPGLIQFNFNFNLLKQFDLGSSYFFGQVDFSLNMGYEGSLHGAPTSLNGNRARIHLQLFIIFNH